MRRQLISHEVPVPTAEDLARINQVLKKVGGQHVVWGAQATLDLWVLEQRALLDQQMSERLRKASWALFWATVGLVVCTGGLIWATFAG